MGMLLTTLALAVVAQGQITGQVIGVDGKPVQKAFLVLQSFGQGAGRNWSERVDCDKDGRFTYPSDSPLRFIIQAYSPDLKESVIVTNNTQASVKSIQLKPSSEITLRFSGPEEVPKGTVHIQWFETFGLPWAGDMDSEGRVKLWLPQGEYAITVQSDDHDFRQANLKFAAGKQEFEIKGTANPFRKLKGQPAPELTILDTMGISKGVSLKDFRGKHVLLEFWGYWCKPCVESSLPGLIQLRKENPGLESKLAILAVHENSGGRRTLPEIQKHLPKFETELWGGKLPFPILLEKEKSLTKTFGIRVYPTAVLIDPEGKVVDRADPETLRKTLGLR